MRKFRVLSLFAALAFAGGSALGQSSADAVKLAPALSVDKVKQGSAFQMAVVVNVENGYHINSNHPTDTFLIGTALKVEKTDGITAGLVRYPKPTLKKFSFSPKPLSVYEGRAVLKFSATAAGIRQVFFSPNPTPTFSTPRWQKGPNSPAKTS